MAAATLAATIAAYAAAHAVALEPSARTAAQAEVAAQAKTATLATPASDTVTPGGAPAGPRVTLRTRFIPDVLGASTTIRYAFTVSEPAPLRSIELRLPAGMGFAGTSLGIEQCLPERLVGKGPSGCPADSVVGHGAALAVVPAATAVHERAAVTAFMGPAEGERLTLLFFIDGRWPVQREVTLLAPVLDLAGASGASILTEAPQLPVWPDGPDIGLIRFHSTIGPLGLTYYRRIHGRRVGFAPRGATVPDRCPRGGFPVRATFSWWDSARTSSAETHVPCPASTPRR